MWLAPKTARENIITGYLLLHKSISKVIFCAGTNFLLSYRMVLNIHHQWFFAGRFYFVFFLAPLLGGVYGTKSQTLQHEEASVKEIELCWLEPTKDLPFSC